MPIWCLNSTFTQTQYRSMIHLKMVIGFRGNALTVIWSTHSRFFKSVCKDSNIIVSPSFFFKFGLLLVPASQNVSDISWTPHPLPIDIRLVIPWWLGLVSSNSCKAYTSWIPCLALKLFFVELSTFIHKCLNMIGSFSVKRFRIFNNQLYLLLSWWIIYYFAVCIVLIALIAFMPMI